MSSGPPPLNIWADMSQVLKFEPWEKPPEGPKSLHYLCSVLSTSLYRADPGKHTTPTKAKDLAHKRAFEWFTEKAHYLWPKSLLEGRFDWDVLFAPPGTYGPARLGAQVMRANVDPVACCVASAAGSTEWRLKTDESGFAHLYLAGSWISTGFDTECIEAAVMAGMQAARALCGSPMRVQGEHFLHQKRLSIYGEIGALIIEGALGVLSVCRLLPDGRGNNKLSIRK
jgi:hypothetical protein